MQVLFTSLNNRVSVRLFFDQNFLSNYELFYGLHVYKNQVHRASNNEIICIKVNFALSEYSPIANLKQLVQPNIHLLRIFALIE